MKFFLVILVGIFFSIAYGARVQIEDIPIDELEGKEFVRALIQQEQWQEAQKAVTRITDPIEQRILIAELELARGSYQQVVNLLAEHKHENAHWLRAQALAKIPGRGLQCLEQLQKLSPQSFGHRFYWLRYACAKDGRQFGVAWNALTQLPSSHEKSIATIEFLLNLNLVEQARREFFAVGEQLSSGELLQVVELFVPFFNGSTIAWEMVQFAKLRFPKDELILKTLAQLSFQKQMPQLSAELFAELAGIKPEFHFHAAELFRQNGKPRRAQFHSLFIQNHSQRVEHQMAVLIDQGRFSELGLLESLALKLKLHEKPELGYALAFALAGNGQGQRALLHLQGRTDQKSGILRSRIEQNIIAK